MDRHKKIEVRRERRRGHVRRLVRGTSARPRLTVFKSNKHISAQIVDDLSGKTLAAASTQQKGILEGATKTGNTEAAKKVGQILAQRATEAGIQQVCFDRGHYKYHGRVAALAQAAREAGLKF